MSYKQAILRRLYFRNPLNLYLGQKLFGNDSGLLANTVGKLALKRDQNLSRLSFIEDENLGSDIQQLRELGWLRLENLDLGNTLNEIRAQFDDYCKNHVVPDSQRLEATTIGGSKDFFKTFPAVKDVLTEQLKNFIQQYYQSHFKILNVHLYRIFPVPESLNKNENYRPYGATGCWHNDGSTAESIKLFVLIDDVDETMGPMHLIDAVETRKIVSSKTYFRYQHDGIPGCDFESQTNIVKFTGKAGTALFANPNTCLHRASEPSSGKKRDMLVFYLTSSGRPLADNWETKAIYEQSLGVSRLFNVYR